MESSKKINLIIKNLGIINYNEAWNIQKHIFNQLLKNKQNGIKNLKAQNQFAKKEGSILKTPAKLQSPNHWPQCFFKSKPITDIKK